MSDDMDRDNPTGADNAQGGEGATPPGPPTPPPNDAGSAPPPPAGGGTLSQDDANMWAMLAHLLALCGLVIPFGNIIAPLLIWQIKGKESSFVEDQGKEAFNFNLTLLLTTIVCMILMLIPVVGCVFMIVPFVLAVVFIVFAILAGLKAKDGVAYRYPATIRFVK